MRNLVLTFSLLLSVSTFAAPVNSYDQVVLMEQGDTLITEETWTMQNSRNQNPMNKVVKCVEFLPENYQQLTNQGLVFITPNQSVSLATTLYICF